MRPSPVKIGFSIGLILILVGRSGWVASVGEAVLGLSVLAWVVRFVWGMIRPVSSAQQDTTPTQQPMTGSFGASPPAGSLSPAGEAALRELDPYQVKAKSVVEEAFRGESREYIETYVDALRSNWQALTATISRTVLLMVVLVTIFYLLKTPGAIGHVSLGPFEVDDPRIVQKSIPIVVAYLFYELVLLGQRWDNSRDLFRLLMERQHPRIHENNLEIFLQPRMPSLIGQTDHSYEFLGTQVRLVTLHQRISGYVVPVLITFVLPIAFEVAAYIYLLNRSVDVLTVGGAALSTMIVLLTLTVPFVVTKSVEPVRAP